MSKLSLAMITKNSGDHIAKTINSVIDFVDEVVVVDNGSTDDTVKILKKLGVKVIQLNPKDNPEYFCEFPKGNFEPHFTRLRRRSFEETTGDWIIWLDADDVVSRPDLIPEYIAIAEKDHKDAIVVRYLYELDEEGNILKEHKKERIVRRGCFEWERDIDWAVHENLYSIKKELLASLVDDLVVVHKKDMKKDLHKSNTRNANILTWMLTTFEKFQKDPRVFYLLARELYTLGRIEDCMKTFNKFLSMEFAPHDGLDTCLNMAEINEGIGDFEKALSYSLRGVSIRPESPMGYIYVARYLNYQGKFQEALDFLKIVTEKKISLVDAEISQPYARAWLYTKARIDALRALKRYEEVIDIINESAGQFNKEDTKWLSETMQGVIETKANEEIEKSIEVLITSRMGLLKKQGKEPSIEDFEDIFRIFGGDIVRLTPLYVRLRRFVKDYRIHNRKEVTIVHTSNYEDWDPESIIKNGGGGSETACVELARSWAKNGWNVTVYASPSEEKEFEGVKWKRFENINMADSFNIFISLRAPNLALDFNINADKKFLWLQDIMDPTMYTQAMYDAWDKIIVLSKYHRNTAYNVPESKFYYTTNGINLDLIKEVEKENIKRIKNKCVYISSADRGLINMVNIWPSVKKAVPNATCFDFYGWKSWDAMGSDDSRKLKKKLIKGMAKVGITDGGRIGKRELYRQLLSADYHTYPLIGPAETSCISVMESQALGATPITTGITALEETQQFGVKVDLQEYEQTLIDTMKAKKTDDEVYRKKMMSWARMKFNWDKIAAKWVKDLFEK